MSALAGVDAFSLSEALAWWPHREQLQPTASSTSCRLNASFIFLKNQRRVCDRNSSPAFSRCWNSQIAQ